MWAIYTFLLLALAGLSATVSLSNPVKTSNFLQNKTITSCIPFENEPGLHMIHVPGKDSFEVLCDDQFKGWTVIQQRLFGGKHWSKKKQDYVDRVDFYRNWADYRQGFGAFDGDGDFFLGLEKIHQMTSQQRHELRIFLETASSSYEENKILYDNFVVAGEDEQYKLTSLGNFTGSSLMRDDFQWHVGMKFSTYDRDNDLWKSGSCAERSHGGWWYHMCASCNLNGKYFDNDVNDRTAIYWDDFNSIFTVKMLIRPKN